VNFATCNDVKLLKLYILKLGLFLLGADNKSRPQSGEVVQCGRFADQGEEFFRSGRPHFLVQKIFLSKFIVCPHGQGAIEPVRKGRRGQFFAILCGRLLWTVSYCKPILSLYSPYYVKVCNEFAVPIFATLRQGNTATCVIDVEAVVNRLQRYVRCDRRPAENLNSKSPEPEACTSNVWLSRRLFFNVEFFCRSILRGTSVENG